MKGAEIEREKKNNFTISLLRLNIAFLRDICCIDNSKIHSELMSQGTIFYEDIRYLPI